MQLWRCKFNFARADSFSELKVESGFVSFKKYASQRPNPEYLRVWKQDWGNRVHGIGTQKHKVTSLRKDPLDDCAN
jgi:hypothetical protein